MMFGRMGLGGWGVALFIEKDTVPLQVNLGVTTTWCICKLVACWPFPGQITSRKAPVFMWEVTSYTHSWSLMPCGICESPR